jgi:hypothetical protein
VLGRIICPLQAVQNTQELANRDSIKDVWSYAYGRIYSLNDLVDDHGSRYDVNRFQFEPYLGSDVSSFNNKVQSWERYCPNIDRLTPSDWDNILDRPQESVNYRLHNETDPSSGVGKLNLEFMHRFAVGRVAWIGGLLIGRLVRKVASCHLWQCVRW